MAARGQKVPPLGVRPTVDVEEHGGARGTRYWARVRWVDPATGKRDGVKRSHASLDAAHDWLERMERAARTGLDTGQTLSAYITVIGDRWARGIDPTSTYDPYAAGLKRRVLPVLGHLPVAMISAGVVDRVIDAWEQEHSRSTVKNSVAALVLVLDEAVRDGLIVRNPARDRARRRTVGRSPVVEEPVSPRDLALPDVATLERLVARVIELHLLQRVAGHQDPAVTSRYLHPDTRAVLEAGAAFSRWWPESGPETPALGVVDGRRSRA